jgi:hypothetical protein
MFKKLLIFVFVIFSSFFLSGCGFKKQQSGVEINTNYPATVEIGGKTVGKTPYINSDMKPEEIIVKLIPDDNSGVNLPSWEGKIKLYSGTRTFIKRDFAPNELQNSGLVLYLKEYKSKKSPSFSVSTKPEGSLVKIDGENKGISPLVIDNLSSEEKKISLSKEGYADYSFSAFLKEGFQLIANVDLSSLSDSNDSQSNNNSEKVVPAETKTLTPVEKAEQVVISDTPTGWLRVRLEPSTASSEAAKVNPGEKFPLVKEQSGWFQIEYEKGKLGWISSSYATKTE